MDVPAHGVLAVTDMVKPTSRAVVDALRRPGLSPVLLTGDNATVARRSRTTPGIA